MPQLHYDLERSPSCPYDSSCRTSLPPWCQKSWMVMRPFSPATAISTAFSRCTWNTHLWVLKQFYTSRWSEHSEGKGLGDKSILYMYRIRLKKGPVYKIGRSSYPHLSDARHPRPLAIPALVILHGNSVLHQNFCSIASAFMALSNSDRITCGRPPWACRCRWRCARAGRVRRGPWPRRGSWRATRRRRSRRGRR